MLKGQRETQQNKTMKNIRAFLCVFCDAPVLAWRSRGSPPTARWPGWTRPPLRTTRQPFWSRSSAVGGRTSRSPVGRAATAWLKLGLQLKLNYGWSWSYGSGWINGISWSYGWSWIYRWSWRYDCQFHSLLKFMWRLKLNCGWISSYGSSYVWSWSCGWELPKLSSCWRVKYHTPTFNINTQKPRADKAPATLQPDIYNRQTYLIYIYINTCSSAGRVFEPHCTVKVVFTHGGSCNKALDWVGDWASFYKTLSTIDVAHLATG